jgi:hypothetical protein
MKQLDPTFTFDGYDFNQLARQDKVALFEKRKANGCFGYEVIIVQRYPAQTIRGIRYPAREAMPSSADWGISGWSYKTLDDAKCKFKALCGQTAGKDQKQHAPAKRCALPVLA